MQYATLRLSKDKDHTQYFDLKFQLIKNNFTQKNGGRFLSKYIIYLCVPRPSKI